MRALALALLLVTGVLAGCMGQPPVTDTPPATSTPVPDSQSGDAGGSVATGPSWAFVDTQGVRHSRDTAAGSPTVLFFMATWCSTCVSKTGIVRQLHEEHAARNLSVFSTSVDPRETQEDLGAWKARYDQPWPHGVDEGRSMQRTFGISSQSSFVVLDAKGEVVKQWSYPGPGASDLRAAIDDAYARQA